MSLPFALIFQKISSPRKPKFKGHIWKDCVFPIRMSGCVLPCLDEMVIKN